MKPRLIEFPVHKDPTGNLHVADENNLPFVPKRAFWITHLERERGNHAHKECEHVVIVMRGSLSIQTIQREDQSWTTWQLQNPKYGLFVPAWTWETLFCFSEDALCLVLASHSYDPLDYIHEFDEFWERISE